MKKPTQVENRDWFSFVLNEHQKPAIPVGPRFQADVPEWNGPPQREYPHKTISKSFPSKWLGTIIWSNKDTSVETNRDAIGKGRPQHCDCYSPGSLLCVKHHVAVKISDLKKDLGSAFQIWKFDEMGEVVAKSWKHSEQQKFARIAKTNPISEDADDFQDTKVDRKKKSLKSKVVLKRKRDGSSDSSDSSDSASPEEVIHKEKKKLKGKGALKVKKDDSPSREQVIHDDLMQQLMKNLLKNSSVKEADEKNELKSKKKGKKKEKELTEAEIQHEKYISQFPILHSRTVPTALYTAIDGIKKVNIEQFLAKIGFSSFFKFNISYIPSRLGRYVVSNFDPKTCQLKLLNGLSIEATPAKVHEMLGIPIGGESFFSLETRPVDDHFEKDWVGQFYPKAVKDIRVNDIALKLIDSKEADFLFKVNFLTLFTNTMGMVAGLKGQINLDVVRRVREDTDISRIDWCEYIFHCLKCSKEPTTLLNQYTGPYTFLVLLYLDSTKYERFSVVHTRPAIKNWSSFLMGQRQDLELKEEVMGDLKLKEEWTESEVLESEGFILGGGSDTYLKEDLVNKVQGKLEVIFNERVAVEELLTIASVEFPNDEKLIELHKKYVQIFKHPIRLNDEDNGDDGDGDDDNGDDDEVSYDQK